MNQRHSHNTHVHGKMLEGKHRGQGKHSVHSNTIVEKKESFIKKLWRKIHK